MDSILSPGATLAGHSATQAESIENNQLSGAREQAFTSSQFSSHTNIPSIIMQTSKTKERKEFLRRQWQSQNPGYEYIFLDDQAAVSFLNSTYGTQYVSAFAKVRPGAVKADFLRLAWLYKKGGFYLDVDQRPGNLEEYKVADVVLSNSRPDQGDGMCQGHVYNAFMAAHPQSAFIKAALDASLSRIEGSWYKDGENDLLSTCYGIAGPVLLGEKLCEVLPDHISTEHTKTSCIWAAGSVTGHGCRAPLKSTMAMQTGESVYIQPEGENASALVTGRLPGKPGRYAAECGRNEIYTIV